MGIRGSNLRSSKSTTHHIAKRNWEPFINDFTLFIDFSGPSYFASLKSGQNQLKLDPFMMKFFVNNSSNWIHLWPLKSKKKPVFELDLKKNESSSGIDLWIIVCAAMPWNTQLDRYLRSRNIFLIRTFTNTLSSILTAIFRSQNTTLFWHVWHWLFSG